VESESFLATDIYYECKISVHIFKNIDGNLKLSQLEVKY
jgi:hypothetical protein